MQFRCYSCGMTFSDTMPPLDALTVDQAAFVGVSTDDQVEYTWLTRSLEGTRFEGMSARGFCEFCLLWIHEFPSVEKKDYDFGLARISVRNRMVLEGIKADVDAAANRMMVLHLAKVIYPCHDLLDLLESLLFTGIEYVEAKCQLPACNRSLGYHTYPHRVNQNTRCQFHNYPKRGISKIWVEMEYHAYADGHDWRLANTGDDTVPEYWCKICMDAYSDWEECMFEAARDGLDMDDEFENYREETLASYSQHSCTNCK